MNPDEPLFYGTERYEASVIYEPLLRDELRDELDIDEQAETRRQR